MFLVVRDGVRVEGLAFFHIKFFRIFIEIGDKRPHHRGAFW
jgi:hypothetical protein